MTSPFFKTVGIREIDLNLTNKCNLRCVHCAFSSCSDAPADIEFNRLCQTLIEAKSLGLEDVHLTGGEPTLYLRLNDVIAFSASQGFKTRLLTNGIGLTRKKLSLFRKSGLASIMYSIDGLAETHDAIRGMKGAFQKTVASIREAKDLGFQVRVNAVISNSNRNQIIDLVAYLRTLNIDVFSFFLYTPTGRNAVHQLNKVVAPDEWRRMLDTLRAYIAREGFQEPTIVAESGYLWEKDVLDKESYRGRGGGCYHLPDILDYLIILSNGDVYPCALLTDKSIRYGNIYERSLADIVAAPENHDVYQSFQERDDLCADCADWDACHAGCRAFSFAHYARWGCSDSRCEKRQTPENSYIPLCPLHKENLMTGKKGGYSGKVAEKA